MIEISDLCFDLPGFTLGPVSLHVDDGGFFALMGPTGSGKTLLLECLSGLLRPSSGTIRLHGRDMTVAPPEQRGIGLVYQDHALFPHMTVLQNIMYGQRYHGMTTTEGRAVAQELARMLAIENLLLRKPLHLSGGERQRVALARALAFRPGIVLLDEPLSALDPQFREGLRESLKQVHKATGAIFFMVTHDFVDALTLADRSAVIRAGRIEQVGPTLDIFHKPQTTFIADFVGMKNIFEARFSGSDWHFAGLRLPAPLSVPEGSGHVALRPEEVHIATDEPVPDGRVGVHGTVTSILRHGFAWTARVQCGSEVFIAQLEHRQVMRGLLAAGSSVICTFDTASLHAIV